MTVLSFATHAQSKKSKGDSKKTQSINFEDELIEGAGKKPDLFWLQSKKKFNFRKLIKLRNDFLPEMERTAEDLKRAGSAD
ncbi:MAG: hypothetical protein H6626_14790 [Pseudobdellovibrionaceae bacterium]|nr:hypothetical protein [Bdellovibrionales bacterium]USN47428.1 MAG: hypothetical protein H6626_14790 [Pseudobdellovibrionaceae bacterium]